MSSVWSQVSCGQWNILSLKLLGEKRKKKKTAEFKITFSKYQYQLWIKTHVLICSPRTAIILVSSGLRNACKHSKVFQFLNHQHVNPVAWLHALSSVDPLQSGVSAPFQSACAVVKLLSTVKLMKLSTGAVQSKLCEQGGTYPWVTVIFPDTKSFQSL